MNAIPRLSRTLALVLLCSCPQGYLFAQDSAGVANGANAANSYTAEVAGDSGSAENDGGRDYQGGRENEGKQRLDELLADIDTLSSEVLQLIIESDGGVLEESSIQMHIKRPKGFYWETIDPFPELVVTDGITLWNYQPDLEQVVLEDWDSQRSELAAKLLSGDTDGLQAEYIVTLRENPGAQPEQVEQEEQVGQGEQTGQRGQVEQTGQSGQAEQGEQTGRGGQMEQITQFDLSPIAADSVYEVINIVFLDSELQSIRVAHKNGQRTVWEFIDLERNAILDDSWFSFEIPDGIEVIDNTSGSRSASAQE